MFSMQRGTPLERAVNNTNNQPHILLMMLTLIFPRNISLSLNRLQCKMTIAIFIRHCVFNSMYNVRVKDFYKFLQEYLLSIPDGCKRTVNFVNICTGVESFLSH